MRIFGTDIYIALVCPDRETGNRHAFDQHEGVAFHHHTVGKGGAIAFVGIADDIFLLTVGARDRLPFYACWKTCAATSAKSRCHDRIDCCLSAHFTGFGKAKPTFRCVIIVERKRTGFARARKGKAGLIGDKGMVRDTT